VSGWIKLHRKIQEHWIWQDKPFDKRSAWVDILLMANHEENKFVLGNELVEVERGSFITSELKLMERWGWSKSKVRNFLSLLQNDGMINKKTDRKKTTITIVNYSDYQDKQTTDKPQKNHKKTAKEPQKDTNKNEKNDKNVKNNIYSQLFDFWNSQKIIVHKNLTDKMEKAIDKALKTNTEEEVKTAMERFAIMLKDECYKYCNYKWTLDEFLSRDKGYKLFLDDGSKWINYKEGSNGTNKPATGQATGTSEKKSKWEQFVQYS